MISIQFIQRRCPAAAAIFVAVGLMLVACDSGHLQAADTAKAAVPAPNATPIQETFMNGKMACKTDILSQTRCMIELLLADIAATYDGGGGGISTIKAGLDNSYTIYLPQEERIDKFTYTFGVEPDGTVSILGKVPSTESF